ncbi:class I SAM-dependent methyltransferase [Belliella kenyensis]|uniref:Class I SAM-dependent methyltransferase n=1 Tax=Belliella kenyensis TaxID=1472724 RepID=A0ABV8EN30_9BACT|nr:class I SAM-dependent methyltransferase [Belliella kenyensis]MCH7401644.1 class I SAM-dependent methyltransferase [Belliella kenyensis]MDN3603078.1 class I SAM-dependent methyltransferase [Belliella kenyensis]
MHDSLSNWKTFGKDDPYYGVLSDPKYKTENLTGESIREFFQTGEEYVQETSKRIEENFSFQISSASILDFGCGVGRLAIPFARQTEQPVVGIDISSDIIAKAKEHAYALDCKNLEFIVYDGIKLPELPTFDLVNSYIVLQHIEKKRGLLIIDELIQKVKIGGIAHIQITHGHKLPLHTYLNFFLRTKVSLYNFLYSSLKHRRFNSEPVMQMNLYHKSSLHQLFSKYSNEIIEVPTDHGGFIGSFFMFRRDK